MTNASINTNINNIPVLSFCANKNEMPVIMPVEIPKFSEKKIIQEAEDFRNNVIYNSYIQEKQNERITKLKKALLVLGAAGAYLVISSKKHK